MVLCKAREISMDALELKKKSRISNSGQEQKAASPKPPKTSHKIAQSFGYQASDTQARPTNTFFATISEKLANVMANMMPCITLHALSLGTTASLKRSQNRSIEFSAHSQGLSASSSNLDSHGGSHSKKSATVLAFPKAGHPRSSTKLFQT